ncbi:DUF1064 domain-containing protein [Acidithiobacillus thiooxidans]|uniref:DUF1064 domain-containing protein n=2 Tax=Acidithiobacillus thiooxidans TaxID=930 RepID=A0A1C2I3L1_ACITH|nr:DUF1064 domain-containing protein [Acidithiobacillus thiooxidans]MBU2834429.1 DUF1064 domain-containing protein [Acidithiobacillus thiooxidans]OCX70606.1 hypothetical protein A6M23_13805 [Acidithiobacillus thiooxidans]OCX82952.1 hypothetical protein A6P08_11285 [Acidithiobacillus thiooxidans]QFX96688.1 hypothetical protein GCD22_02498 [Acidithiobacillus thiooxidans ATCC 19377]
MIRHKFHARQTELDGIRFTSKREAQYYAELLLRQLRQKAGEVRFVDVKGIKTDLYLAKKRLVESLYLVVIEEA